MRIIDRVKRLERKQSRRIVSQQENDKDKLLREMDEENKRLEALSIEELEAEIASYRACMVSEDVNATEAHAQAFLRACSVATLDELNRQMDAMGKRRLTLDELATYDRIIDEETLRDYEALLCRKKRVVSDSTRRGL